MAPFKSFNQLITRWTGFKISALKLKNGKFNYQPFSKSHRVRESQREKKKHRERERERERKQKDTERERRQRKRDKT